MATLKKREDGRYRVKYHGRYFYGDTEREAKQKRDDFIRQEKNAITQRQQDTVAEYASRWLPSAKAGVSTKTYNDYANQIDKLIKTIGVMRLIDVKPSNIKAVYMQFVGLSDSTIHRAHMLYVELFESALNDDFILKNPAKADTAQPHKGTSGTHRALKRWEKDQILLNTSHPLMPAVAIMLYAGLRKGQVLALTTNDIDLNENTITVNKAVRYESNQPIITKPKTDAGVRVVPIFEPLRPFLERLQPGLVCKSVQGTMMSQAAWKSAWNSFILMIEERMNGCTKRWKPKDHEWRHINIRAHDLRHTFCTMLRDNGIDIKVAMKWLGHADEKMILRVYDHIDDDRISNSINAVNRAIGGQIGGQN